MGEAMLRNDNFRQSWRPRRQTIIYVWGHGYQDMWRLTHNAALFPKHIIPQTAAPDALVQWKQEQLAANGRGFARGVPRWPGG